MRRGTWRLEQVNDGSRGTVSDGFTEARALQRIEGKYNEDTS